MNLLERENRQQRSTLTRTRMLPVRTTIARVLLQSNVLFLTRLRKRSFFNKVMRRVQMTKMLASTNRHHRQHHMCVERRPPLPMVAGVKFASNSWTVGGTADLYTGGVHEDGEPSESLYITRESLFRCGRVAPSGASEWRAPVIRRNPRVERDYKRHMVSISRYSAIRMMGHRSLYPARSVCSKHARANLRDARFSFLAAATDDRHQ